MNAMSTCLTNAGYRMVGPPSDEATGNFQVRSSNAEADQQMRDDPGYKKAYDRCAASTGFKQFTSGGAGHKPTAQQIQKTNQQTLKVYSCLRQKGWTLPNPTKDSNGLLSPPLPPSDVRGNQARMSQLANDINSCASAAGLNGKVQFNGGGGSGGGGVVTAGG
jgi:hypothetical protein